MNQESIDLFELHKLVLATGDIDILIAFIQLVSTHALEYHIENINPFYPYRNPNNEPQN